jgi:hypothetical protein
MADACQGLRRVSIFNNSTHADYFNKETTADDWGDHFGRAAT